MHMILGDIKMGLKFALYINGIPPSEARPGPTGRFLVYNQQSTGGRGPFPADLTDGSGSDQNARTPQRCRHQTHADIGNNNNPAHP